MIVQLNFNPISTLSAPPINHFILCKMILTLKKRFQYFYKLEFLVNYYLPSTIIYVTHTFFILEELVLSWTFIRIVKFKTIYMFERLLLSQLYYNIIYIILDLCPFLKTFNTIFMKI